MVAFSLFPGDTVALIVLLGVALGALSGRMAGGIRVVFFLLALGLALGFGHLLAGFGLFATVTELSGFENSLWQLLIPRLLATLVLTFGLVLLLESVYRKIYLHYKYKYKDGFDAGEFDTWEYLNAIWGLTLGVVAGIVCIMVFLSWLHVPGYLLLQVRPMAICEKVDPWGHRLLRRICMDLHALGLETSASRLGPAEARFYEAADTVGYIYHNYSRTNLYERQRFHQRVFGYPGISPMLRQKEIKALWTNSAFQQLWVDNTNFYHITGHSGVAPLLRAACLPSEANGTSPLKFMEHLAKLDLTDYQKFLREGRSDVYQTDNPDQAAVVGTWQLEVVQTYDRLRRKYPQAREPGHLDVLSFLRQSAFQQYGVSGKVPLRQYDWILTFTADREMYSTGRYFPTGPLFKQLNQMVSFAEPSLHPRSVLWASGRWNAPASGQSEFMADLSVYSRPPSTIQVFITPANDHLIIRFPDNYNREEYVFRRYEF
jgi:hypothetical protein